MTVIEINGTNYQAITAWEELGLSKFVELCNLPMPERLLELFKNINDKEKYDQAFDQVTYEDNVKTFPEYFGHVIEILSDVPRELIDLIDWEQRTAIYYAVFHVFALSSVHSFPLYKPTNEVVPYEPDEKEFFEHEGERYYYPKTLRLSGIEVPLAGESIITFTEASDILKAWREMSERGAEHIALIAAIYCRKKGEEYDETKAMERAVAFANLPMDVYWRLFFCIQKQVLKLASDIQTSITRQMEEKERRLLIQPGLIRLEVGG